jgi:hypothetical protein
MQPVIKKWNILEPVPRKTNGKWKLSQIKKMNKGPLMISCYSHPMVRFCFPYRKSKDLPCINCNRYFHVTKWITEGNIEDSEETKEDSSEWVHGYMCQRSYEEPMKYVSFRMCLSCVSHFSL